MVAVEECLNAGKPRVQRFKCEGAPEKKMRQQALAVRGVTRKTGRQQSGVDKDFLQDLHLKSAAITADMNEWRRLETEVAEELRVAQTDVALKSALRETAWMEMDVWIMAVTARKKHLTARTAKLLQFTAKHVERIDGLSRLEWRSATMDTVSDAVKSVAGVYERQTNRTKLTRRYQKPSAIPSTAS